MRAILLLAALPMAAGLVGCREDDVKLADSGDTAGADSGIDGGTGGAGGGTDSTGGGTDSTGGGTGGSGGGTIVGDWLSEGENLSPLSRDVFGYVSLEATFGSDGTYSVHGVDGGGAVYDFVGTYTVDTTTDPARIRLVEQSPTTWTFEGIYQLDGDTLTYEVVVVDPDYGYTAPTPESGFGSTAGPQLSEGDNVQVYVRQ